MVLTDYAFQKQALLRGLSSSQHYERVKAGFYGEEKFSTYLKEFGSAHWTILRNKWFKNDSPFECDVILITSCRIYVFEVKNYIGKFEYKNGQSYSRGRAITYNPINQARNARLHLQNLVGRYHVQGALVFIGEHNQVCINDPVEDIAILETNEVYEFIQQIKRDEQQFTGRGFDTDRIIQQVERFEIAPPYMPAPFTKEQMKKARTGILCAHCQKKVAVTRAKYIKCPCGLHESKEEAIVRTACEYGILTYGQDFVVSDIYNFIGQSISINYTRSTLMKNFEQVYHNNILSFRNLNTEFSQIVEKFSFDSPKMYIF